MRFVFCALLSTLLLTACGQVESLLFYKITEDEAIVQQETVSKVYRAEDTISISWKVQLNSYSTKEVSIEHSLNGGIEWNPVATVQASSQFYSWTAPKANITDYKVRASFLTESGNRKIFLSSEPTVLDNLDPVVSLGSLRGREILRGGASVDILWSAQDVSFPEKPIDLFYSTNEGYTWVSIATGLSNSGRYAWTVPILDSSKVRIKVVAKDSVGNSSADASEANLTIDATAPTLQLLFPLGGESLVGDSTTTIRWTANDSNLATNPVKIEFSGDAGVTWSPLANAALNSGSQSWQIAQADAVAALVRVSVRDLAGHVTQAVSSSFSVSRLLPKVGLNQATQLYTTSDDVTFTGSCDLGPAMVVTDVTVTGPEGVSVVPCNGVAPLGSWSYTTASFSSDGKRLYSFAQTNISSLTATLISEWTRDTQKPVVSSVVINGNDEFAQSPFAQIQVTAIDENSFPLKIYLAETATVADPCVFSTTNSYQQFQATEVHPFTLTMGFVDKKVCAWAEDRAGNRSLLSAAGGTLGIDMDVINFDLGNPPQITAFNVINPKTGGTNFAIGDVVKVEWTATDAEGLANNPIYLEFTQDGENWTPLVSGYGSLSGNPTTYSGSYQNFTAPSTQFLQLRIRAKDKAGNYSYRVSSNSLNSGAWSIFAGNLDKGFGSAARTAVIDRTTYRSGQIAIHPLTGDIYVVSDNEGLLKVDIKTGVITKIAGYVSQKLASPNDPPDWSLFNLSENGGSLGAFNINTYINGMAFDKNGKLYILFSYTSGATFIGLYSSRVYQIDLDKRTSRLYAGGGTSTVPEAGPLGLHLDLSPLTFDENNSLYLAVQCEPQLLESVTTRKLFKITQTDEGLPDKAYHVAGNCAKTSPVAGTLAVNTSFAYSSYFNYGSLTVSDHGKKIYYSGYNTPVYKIIDGVHYTTALSTNSTVRQVLYSTKSNVLYIANGNVSNGSVQKWTPSFSASNGGETLLGLEVSGGGTAADCLLDEVSAQDACVGVTRGMDLTPQDKLVFIDSPSSTARVRYVDDSQQVRTLAGTLPFYGKDLHKSLLRTSTLGSIYNKTTTEPGSIYTPGLYFVDGGGQLFGRIGASNIVEILWGTQKTLTTFHAAGAQTGPTVPIGQAYGNDVKTMTFDSSGLPWIRYNKRLISLSATGTVVARQTSSGSWDTAALGSNPTLTGMYPYGLYQNIYLKGSSVFVMGKYTGNLSPDTDAPFIRLFDFGNSTISHIMGGVGGPTSEPDHLTATDLTNKNLSSLCNSINCANQFVEGDPNLLSDDKLYFSEGRSVRVITNPLTPGSQTLKTLFTTTYQAISDNYYAANIVNFFVTPDESKIFYIYGDQVYCESIDNISRSWCNGASIGPVLGATKITKIPNQFTMLDVSTLLISTGQVILQYKFPTP